MPNTSWHGFHASLSLSVGAEWLPLTTTVAAQHTAQIIATSKHTNLVIPDAAYPKPSAYLPT